MIAVRYLVVLARGSGDAGALAERLIPQTGLIMGCQTARIAVLVDSLDHCIALETGEGAFVGHVFQKGEAPSRMRSIPRGFSHSIVASAGSSALDDYWGAYVLACDNRHHDAVWLARDPSGALPCYSASYETVELFASDVSTLIATGCFVPTIDQAYLLRHMANFDISFPETCLEGLTEILPGMQYLRTATASTLRSWWSPWKFANAPKGDSFPVLAEHLKETIGRCGAAWASCCDHVLVSLSGGLDSSIVTNAVHDSRAELSAFTMVADDADGDERVYARQVCEHFGLDLSEARYDPTAVDLTIPGAPYLPRPLGIVAMQSLKAAIRKFTFQKGVDACFNGVGGDSVFCTMSSALAVADALAARRSIGAILRTAGDIATLTEASVPSVLRQALRLWIKGRRPLRTDGVGMYLSSHARSTMAAFSPPPWFVIPEGTSPGRSYHVEMIARLQPFLDGFDRHTEMPALALLLSQPIVELCLAIPSWQWVSNGRNRSVARCAFASTLPKEILERRSKSGPDAMSVTVCLENLALLREILLDGELARRELLDRPLLEQTLTRAALVRSGEYRRLLLLADMEAWVRHWSNLATRSPQPAAALIS